MKERMKEKLNQEPKLINLVVELQQLYEKRIKINYELGIIYGFILGFIIAALVFIK